MLNYPFAPALKYTEHLEEHHIVKYCAYWEDYKIALWLDYLEHMLTIPQMHVTIISKKYWQRESEK